MLQNSGMAFYVFSHHHHCNTQNKCTTDEASCVPENDDCSIAKTIKDVTENEKKSDNKKSEINSENFNLFCEDLQKNNFTKTLLDDASIKLYGTIHFNLLHIVQTVLTPPPNIC